MARARGGRIFDALPRELLLQVLHFLTGVDAFPLSHVNRFFFTDLLAPDSAFWRERVPGVMRIAPYEWLELARNGWGYVRSFSRFRRDSAWQRRAEQQQHRAQAQHAYEQELHADPKRHYFDECVSLLFTGQRDTSKDDIWRNKIGHVNLAQADIDAGSLWASESCSFDVWLALLPPSESLGGLLGGVLLGAQSSDHHGATPPHAIASLVHVDPIGNLFCSVASSRKRCLASLELGRWYHLAVTMDRSTGTGEQRVYLDGNCIDIQTVDMHDLPHNWSQLDEFHIGSGFVDEGSTGSPGSVAGPSTLKRMLSKMGIRRAPFRGRFGFNGLVDEFRLWYGALGANDIAHLAHGREEPVYNNHGCRWSLMRDARYTQFHGDLWAAQSTRPCERVCDGVRRSFRVWSVDEMKSIRA